MCDVYIHTCIHEYICLRCVMCIYTYLYTNVCIYDVWHIYAYIYIWTYIYMLTEWSINVHTSIHEYICIRYVIYTHIYMYTHISIHDYIYIRCVIYMFTNTPRKEENVDNELALVPEVPLLMGLQVHVCLKSHMSHQESRWSQFGNPEGLYTWYAWIYIHTYLYIYEYIADGIEHRDMCIYIYIHIYIHVHVFTYIHIHTHKHMYITCAWTNRSWPSARRSSASECEKPKRNMMPRLSADGNVAKRRLRDETCHVSSYLL